MRFAVSLMHVTNHTMCLNFQSQDEHLSEVRYATMWLTHIIQFLAFPICSRLP